MNEFDPENPLKRAQEILDALKQNGFSPLEGDTHLSRELEFTVATLAKMQYRGFDSWTVHTQHRFNCDGIGVKTYVTPVGSLITQFTPEEAIAIASAIAAKGLKQPEENRD